MTVPLAPDLWWLVTPISLSAYARHRGVSTKAVSKAVAVGRLRDAVTRASGQPRIVDVELADREWIANTRPRVDFNSHGPRRRRQCVYFIQCVTGPAAGPIKIGVAVDVDERLAQLQCGSPFRLRVLGTVAGGYTLEADLHQRLAAHRMHGEWFRDTAEVRTLIWEIAGA